MVNEQVKLGPFQDRYAIACNRPDCDKNWDSAHPAWLGKASMSKHHALLIVKDLHWEWFNVLTFGLVSCLENGVTKLEEMKAAALLWANATEGWPASERIGLFLHVEASVKSAHLHILDMDNLGPTFDKLSYRNLPIDEAIHALREELRARNEA